MTENKAFNIIVLAISVVLAISEASVYDNCGPGADCFAIPPLLSSVEKCIEKRVILLEHT